MKKITILGGGLAGCEAAWQAVRRGVAVDLYEMKPERFSPAHESESLAELVCSNSLRSNAVDSAVGLLKEEMRRLDSLILRVADATAVPAGMALAVDREKFAAMITATMEAHELITIHRQELTSIPPATDAPIILATGPLTSAALADDLKILTGGSNLAFYDAIAPIVSAESLNMDIIYRKSRWDDEGPGDYLNCPMDEGQYTSFVRLLVEGETVPLKAFEEAKYFEGCLPIEIMAQRGEQTLRFGPMKPIGLRRPGTDKTPYAVVQLRAENRAETMYNMVGFQTKLTYAGQKRVFRTIPGLEEAEFVRLGSIHRNTFICAPALLTENLTMQTRPNLYLAGQLSGVEGYVESAAMGLLAGINAARCILGQKEVVPPPETAHGSLIGHLIRSSPDHFQPSNVNFGLFPPLAKKIPKKLRGQHRAEIALASLQQWQQCHVI